MLKLPISSHLEAICRLIAGNAITTIIAPTGTGKSIGIPWITANSNARTFVAVPTITSARSLWKYFRMVAPNIKAGYAAEGEVHYNDEDLVVYATAGHVRRKVLELARRSNPAQWDFCSVLVVDEIHTGIVDNRVIQGLWKHSLEHGGRVPRLVLTSASASNKEGATYIVEDKSYPVQIIYNDKDYEDYNTLIRAAVERTKQLHSTSGPGHFLVFVAGSSDVEAMVRNLSDIGALVLPAYGQLEGDALQRIYEPSTERKIIVATNVAEASITIKDVSVVVDTLHEKRLESSSSGGPRLVLRTISQDSAQQRAGRTGRTGPGVCYRMCTAEGFSRLEPSRPEEIFRVPIHGPIIELLDVGLSPLEILGISDERFRSTLRLLQMLGMVAPTLRDPAKLEVTEMGHFSTTVPLGVRMSAALWLWIKGGFPLFPGVVVVVLIDSSDPPYYKYPRREPKTQGEKQVLAKREHRKKYFERFVGRSDVHTFLNIWDSMMSYIGGPDGKKSDIRRWSEDNSMRYTKMLEVVRIVRRISATLRNKGVEYSRFTTKGVVTALRPIIKKTHSDLLPGLLYSNSGRQSYGIRGTGRFLLDSDSVNTLSINPPLVIAALVEREIVSRGPSSHLVSVALDIEDPPSRIESVDVERSNIPRSTSIEGRIDLASALARVNSFLSK